MVRYLAIFFAILIITITNPVKGLQETQGQTTRAIREINKILPEIKEEKKAHLLGILGNLYLQIEEPHQALSRYRLSDRAQPSLNAKLGIAQSLSQLNQEISEEIELMEQEEEIIINTAIRNLKDLVEQEQNKRKELKEKQTEELSTIITQLRDNGTKRQKIIATIIGYENNLLKDNFDVEEIIKAIKTLPDNEQYLVNLSKQFPNETANILNNPKSAQGLEQLSRYYFQINDLEKAKTLSYQSLNKQKREKYSTLWLTGQIETAMGNLDNAIANYKRANQVIERRNFNLIQRRKMEIFYQEYLEILLKKEKIEEAFKINQAKIIKELETYLGFPCPFLSPNTNQIVGLKDIIITTIVLDNETHIIKQKQNKTKHYTIDITREELRKLIKNWQIAIYNILEPNKYKKEAKILYNLLIKPLELEKSEVKKLIFNNDTMLRNIPMAALYNGNQHLIEKYEISSSLEINTNQRFPQTLILKSLLLGISQPNEGVPLPNVEREIEQLSNLVNNTALTNEQFTINSLIKELNSGNYNSVHIASHGIFGGTSSTSFLLAHDRAISITELIETLKLSDLNLLVLSACETATGNPRSILGMSGIGIETGINKTLGTLWALQDSKETVEIMINFYQGIKEGNSESLALKKAITNQIQQNTHVSNWATPILIEN